MSFIERLREEVRIAVYVFSNKQNRYVFYGYFDYDEKRIERLRRNKRVLYEVERWYH